ncbi:hypothetical protein GA0111570_104231 [Raineyella antarctica]|uniref:Uncharacterized protein n=1 Tax=Raineyella antarctica TaxID=1577474 RepID=A0A1G6GPY8_9ACTN|nr:hypothetical protein [Raineyella antarctica]SDB84011.1 hypothetical protein GA0111570_104231 [Raineyella antarctica]
MSSRIGSDFGSLGDRTAEGAGARQPVGAGREGRTHWVEIDDGAWLPGLLVSWSRSPAGWLALVAWVADGQLMVATVPSDRVRPVK